MPGHKLKRLLGNGNSRKMDYDCGDEIIVKAVVVVVGRAFKFDGICSMCLNGLERSNDDVGLRMMVESWRS